MNCSSLPVITDGNIRRSDCRLLPTDYAVENVEKTSQNKILREIQIYLQKTQKSTRNWSKWA